MLLQLSSCEAESCRLATTYLQLSGSIRSSLGLSMAFLDVHSSCEHCGRCEVTALQPLDFNANISVQSCAKYYQHLTLGQLSDLVSHYFDPVVRPCTAAEANFTSNSDRSRKKLTHTTGPYKLLGFHFCQKLEQRPTLTNVTRFSHLCS